MRISRFVQHGVAVLTALLVTVASGSTAHAAAATGTVDGLLTTAAGGPAGSVSVAVYTAVGSEYLAGGNTDADGRYSIPDVPVGRVKVLFQPSFDQWAPRQTDYAKATAYTVAAGRTTTVDDQLLPSGTVSGRLVDPAGAALAYAEVTAQLVGNDTWVSTFTAEDGRYSLEVLPGDYTIGFKYSAVQQWAPAALTIKDAQRFTVTVGSTVTVDETLLPTGSITGSYVDAAGKRVTEVEVGLWRDGERLASAYPEENGTFTLDRVLPGAYKMSFQTPDGNTQWAYGRPDEESAAVITVTAGQQTIVNEKPPATGTIAGTFLTRAGKAVAKARVLVSPDGEGDDYSATTDSKGRFRIAKVLTGTYKVRFEAGGLTQWAYATQNVDKATAITVTDGATTTVTDTQIPPATLTVTAKDARTGKLVKNICVYLSGLSDRHACAKGSAVTVKNLAAGRHDVTVRPADTSLYQPTEFGAALTAGKATSATAKLTLGGAIAAVVTDRKTGKPVAGACITPIKPVLQGLGDGSGECTDKKGRIRTRAIEPGVYTVFMEGPGVYGAQWVGKAGGTGDQRKAARVTVKAGKVAAAPKVKLDKAGTVTGVVTTAADGKPVKDANVSFHAWHFRVGPSRGTSTDAKGRFTLAKQLGPYAWPLVFTYGDRRQFSGGVGNRFAARTVTVVAGKTVKHNEAMVPGVTISGTVKRASGPFRYGIVSAYNTVTGDPIGDVEFQSDGAYTMTVPGGQTVALTYFLSVKDGQYVDGWYGGKDITKAKKVSVPKSGSTTVNFTVK